MKLKFTIPIFLMMWAIAFQLSAQSVKVTGMVSSTEGDPLIGANITVVGVQVGTITDLEGKYEIEAEKGATILFSYVGYEDKEIALGEESVIDVILGVGISLDEVVVTALGVSRQKKALGYAVDEIKSDEISNSGRSDVVSALQGRVAGLNIQSSSGAPGAGSSVSIRGISSLDPNRGNRPLYVIDGIEVSDDVDIAPVKPGGADYGVGSNNATQGSVSNRIMDINPEDIESVSVLKGAAATALYGVRAANGVIVINTKKGSSGDPVIDINFGAGFGEVNRFPKVQLDYLDGHRNTTKARSFLWDNWGPKVNPDNPVRTYNVYEQLYRRAINSSFGASVRAGTERFNYRFSGSRSNSDGIVPTSYYNKTNFSMNADYKVSKKFKIGTSFMYTNANANTPHEGRKSVANVLAYTANVADMTFYNQPYVLGDNFAVGIVDHALFLAQNNKYYSKLNRFIGNANFKYEFTPKISMNYVVGLDNYADSRDRIIHPQTDEGQSAVNGPPYGFTAVSNIGKTAVTSNAYLSWGADLGSYVSLSGNIGQYVYGYDRKRVSIVGKKFQLDNFYNLNNAVDFEQTNSLVKYRNMAVYGDVTAGIGDYLYLTFTARNDWSSTLPADNNSYFFPSGNISWVVSDMVTLPKAISFLKLRGSYSIVGKDADPYVVGTYYNSSFAVPFNEIVGYRASTSIGDENLKPEFTTSKEFGAEVNFFSNRFGVDFTYYNNYVNDMILPVPLSNASGAARYVTNAGAMSTKGMEITSFLDVFRSPKGFNWSITGNWSKYKGTVEEINTGVDEIAIMSLRDVDYTYKLGESIGDLYINPFERTDGGSDDYFDGDLIIQNDGLPYVDWDTLVNAGSALPDFVLGLNNDITYKGFGLSFLWEWKKGGKVIDIARNYSIGNGQLEETNNRWEQVVFDGVMENESGEYVQNTQEVELTAANWYRNWRTYRLAPEAYLQDASWIRLRNVNVYFSIPKHHIKNDFIKGVKFTLSGSNLFLNTPFRGWDPESNYFGPSSNIYGYLGMRTPATKTYNLKVNITF